MGKNKDKKKKGKGMEKTVAKTEKKAQKRLDKELKEIGEENIEELIATFQQKDKELSQIKEDILTETPSPRSGASFNALTERDEFVLFGGEYDNGSKIFMYNDLLIYNIKKNQWSSIRAPKPPPPRSSHQSAILARNQGELWIFGGEFVSPTQSQFYHYNDLWVFRFQTKQWEKINALHGPSPRSGHRMTIYKKYLVVFGGFHDNLRDCRYFNDTYVFNLDTFQWQELKFSSTNELPSPRSACQLSVASKNNAVIVYGGYSKEKLKKDQERGIVHTDMFALSLETKKDGKTEWIWKKCKQTGAKPSVRCSFSMITLNDDSAVLFGGVYDHDEADDDEDDEENAKSTFYNDLFKLDLETYKWKQLVLKGKRIVKKTKSTKKEATASAIAEEDDEEDEDSADDAESNEAKTNEKPTKNEDENLEINKLNIQDEGVFELSYNPNKVESEVKAENNKDEIITINTPQKPPFSPLSRRNAYLQLHKGLLYLYGGCFEAKNGKEITLSDMYCLNIKKLDEWKILFEDKTVKSADMNKINELLAKESSDEDEEDGDEEDEDNDDDDDSEMEIDAPDVEENENIEKYYERTKDFWIGEAKKEFPDEKSNKIILKMSNELCNMFFKAIKSNQSDESTKRDTASNF